MLENRKSTSGDGDLLSGSAFDVQTEFDEGRKLCQNSNIIPQHLLNYKINVIEIMEFAKPPVNPRKPALSYMYSLKLAETTQVQFIPAAGIIVIAINGHENI
jgi:hypothetical protein